MLDRLRAGLARFWQGFLAFTPGQKVVAVVALLGVAAAAIGFSAWASRPDYTPMYTNLAAKDASAMVDQLTKDGVKYQLTDGGATIEVPKGEVYAERLKMASAGLPNSSDTGYSLLDKQGVTTSEFTQRVDYQRALEGEITNTLQSVNGVSGASVHLAIPERDVFNDGSQNPTASVLLTLAPGKQLTSQQVQSVVNLVAFAVPGLQPENVTVADSAGKVLAAPGQGANAGSGDRAQATQDYESNLQTSLNSMFQQVLGPNSAVVTVTADLDFDSVDTTSKNYTFNQGTPPIAESHTTENYTGTGGGVGGVLGAEDPATVTGGTTQNGNGTYSKTTNTQNNAVNEVTQVRRAAPGNVRRLGVAVIVNQNKTQVGTAQVQSLVNSALAIDPQRGDTVTVTSMPFDTTAANQAAQDARAQAQAAAQARRDSLLRTGLLAGAVALLVIGWAVAAFLRRRRARNAELDDEIDDLLGGDAARDEELTALRQQLADAEWRAQAAAEPQPEQAVATVQTEPPVTVAKKRHDSLAELADSNPDDVARLLRGWLTGNTGKRR